MNNEVELFLLLERNILTLLIMSVLTAWFLSIIIIIIIIIISDSSWFFCHVHH